MLTNERHHRPLKTTLACYKKIKTICLSSPATTSTYTVTKVYIVENCFLPDGYLTKELLLEIINHLGTPTVFSRYRIQT
ncbi:ANM_HP_G0212850.mRNA.1.CDS.1 [Saccharomyces cerevisiae]|nr:ANM_HP_G0212850.mRNA.1.CDS.1 [Saccharomyces cerevisiae]CAI6972720.1 ANM_HP_G0212850.mRNA.1.CDS.1 [Saccharomyces cerevisiae]